MDVERKPSNLIKGATGEWEVVIGMEIHAQVTSQSKLFSGAATAFGGDPNSHVSLVDAAMPGMLPVINEECIEQAVRTGLGLVIRLHVFTGFVLVVNLLVLGLHIRQRRCLVVALGSKVAAIAHHGMRLGFRSGHIRTPGEKRAEKQTRNVQSDSFIHRVPPENGPGV